MWTWAWWDGGECRSQHRGGGGPREAAVLEGGEGGEAKRITEVSRAGGPRASECGWEERHDGKEGVAEPGQAKMKERGKETNMGPCGRTDTWVYRKDNNAEWHKRLIPLKNDQCVVFRKYNHRILLNTCRQQLSSLFFLKKNNACSF